MQVFNFSLNKSDYDDIDSILSMVETTSTKTRTMKTKTTTISAMIVIATIIAFPLAANKIAFAAGTRIH